MAAKHQVDDLRKAGKRATTRVPGHELYREGAAYVDRRRPILAEHPKTHGFGRCSCGKTSEVLDSNAKRKAWHRAHKLEVLNG